MKKRLFVLAVSFLMMVASSSCKFETRKALEIELSELNSACDYVDAIELILDEMIETKGDGIIGQLTETKTERMDALIEKYILVAKDAGNKFSKDELSQCSNFNDTVEKFMKIEGL